MKLAKEIFNEAPEDESISAWREDEYGAVMRFGNYEVRLEPLLFGGVYLAVYEFDDNDEPCLIGQKLPVEMPIIFT